MQSFFLSYRSSRIHYLKGGQGNKLLVCFHGYGESAGSFDFLESSLSDLFTVITIDLPFHGKTEWKEGLSFGPADLLVILSEIGVLSEKGGLVVMGFSLGGRVALSLLEKIPDRIEKMVLLAPDGLKVNFWYRLATQNRAGNLFFRFTMRHPAWFFTLLRAGHFFRLINPSVYKFTSNYIDNLATREELYLRWTALRRFRPCISKIARQILERKIPIRLLYGQYDRIIRFETGLRFQKKIHPYGELHLLSSGHKLLQEKYLEAICACLKS